MSFLNRAADAAQKTAVMGLVGMFGFQLWQIGKNCYHGIDHSKPHPQKEYIETLRDQADEDYKKHYKIDHRDWYDKDDDSYLENAPKPKPPTRYFK
mmetsp:Transcript_5806/g.9647  ORF Transcript_5806/g.9647 Transcript_5806/m.9647 type:complete len:96 (-) Transcript_5806:115-402(-)|eukprot:CAMPEP_0119012486 /NCGR_PEP_ID=MMETSP1176-20130426/6795_1 /TAXON_ID=265551 /ORGANISM="Synedropsis recta cf, Strain CCMP1620" /LENGTH=95 /DNA_ID=CAMNT_0006965453 /DNA_START=219 /DNA_END=506 /DNA_ORIENTATION=+